MPKGASHRPRRLLPLLLLALTGCAGQLLAATCDHPLVSFSGGQLTISSDGCSLQQVLTAVSRETGAKTEIPSSAGALPIFANLGPGDPRRVVSALLQEEPFNWTLATDPGGSGSLLRVVLSDRVPYIEAPSVAAASAQKNSPAGGTATAALGPPIQPSEQPRRAQIDDSTLSKLPPLPAGVPSAMWQLYPGLVDNGGAVQSGAPTLPNGQTASAFPNPVGNPDMDSLKGCKQCPVPPGIDPNIRNLYPWNLMQLVQQPITLPNIHLPPAAQPIINH